MFNEILKKSIVELDFTIGSILASLTLVLTLIFCYLLVAFEHQKNKIGFYKEVLEYSYYISQIAIVFIAIIGLIQFLLLINQLILSKADIEIRTKREARVLSLQVCTTYKEEILPELIKINKFMNERDIPKIDVKSTEVTQDELKTLTENWFKEWYNSIKLIIPDINKALNNLDSFSAYFIKELADEEIAFSLAGLDYCKAIEDLLLFITYTKISSTSFEHYKNISLLYEIWTCKINNLEHFKLDPIGTKIDEYIKNEIKG